MSAGPLDPNKQRQQVLFLWLEDSSLEGRVVGWSFFDGADPATDWTEMPYANGLAALADGWRLIQVSPLTPPIPGHEHEASFLKHEYIFERVVDLSNG